MALNGGGTLGGTTSQNTSASGVATFNDLTASQTGSKTLTASVTSPSLSVQSASFTVTPGAIDHYSVSTSPATRAAAFNVTVTAQDQFNNTVTTDNSTVVAMSAGSANVQFDSNGDTTFGDKTKTLSSGTFTISTKDNIGETVTITATDGSGKTGTSSSIAIGAVAGDFVSRATGNWNSTATWSNYTGSAWVNATTTPTGGAGTNITIQSSDTVTDNVAVNLFGRLVVQGTLSFSGSGTITNGAGSLLQNSGTVNSSGSTLVFKSGATYQNNFTTGTGAIPTASWNPGSTCEVIGYTSATGGTSGVGGYGQTFANFIWNCPNQTATFSCAGDLRTVNGNFTVADTGSGSFVLGIGVAGDLAVGGNFSQSGGTFRMAAGTAARILTVTNNFSLSGGTFDITSSGDGTLNVGGNFSHTGGTFTETAASSPSANVIFNGTAAQTYTSGGTVSGTINFTVNNGANVMMGTSLLGNGSSGTFTLASGGTLGIGDPSGITTSGATGNVRVTGTRSFGTAGNYTYNGTAAQVTGNALTTVSNLEITNAAGVKLTTNVTVNGTCTIDANALLLGTNDINGAVVINGTIAAGASIGKMNTARQTWNGGGSYQWEINNATGAPGTGWDLLSLTSGQGINLQATSGNPFTIKMVSLNGSSAGSAANFNNAITNTWIIAITTNATVTNFVANKFTVNASAFSNALGGGSFSVVMPNATNLAVRFSPLNKIMPVITWNNPANITYGTALSGTQLNATSGGIPGTFVYTPASGTVLNAGNGQILSVQFTPTDTVTYDTPAPKTVTINVAKATPVVTWNNPAGITYGTALSGTQLNATASVAGSFVYNPLSGTVLNAGNGQNLNVAFTPTDTVNYNTSNATVQINVTKSPLTVRADDMSRPFGTANPTLTVSYLGFVNNDNTNALSGSPSLNTSALISSPIGTYPITVSVAGLSAANYSFTPANGTLTISNFPPSFEAMTNQTVFEDQPTHAIQLVLNDDSTDELDMQPSGVSDNQDLVPNGNIFFGQANGHWYTTVTPVFGKKSGTANITVTVSDGTVSTSRSFLFTVNPPPAGAARFFNSSPIAIPTVGTATPYPSSINVAGRSGTITNMTVTLSKLSHKRVQELNMLLVGPTTNMVIFSHVSNGNRSVTNVTVHLSDDTTYPLPIDYALWSEPLWPTAYAPVASFPGAPTPTPGPYGTNHFSSTFNGTDANGTWSLYVYDDTDPTGGSIAGGWSLMIATSGGGSLPPQISDITNRTVAINTNTGPIPFTIDDGDTVLSGLTLSRGSSNTNLVPTNNIVFGGTGSNRTVTVTPVAGQTGTATITVSVSDGVNTGSDSFVLTVSATPVQVRVETAADGSGVVVAAQNRNPDSSMTVYAIVRDAFGNFIENVAGASWSLTNVAGGVAGGDLVVAGNGSSATFTAHAPGSGRIHVTSGALTPVDSGTLTVLSSAAPTISGIANQTNLIGTPLGPFSIPVFDTDTLQGNLTLRVTSSDTNLVPETNIIVFNDSFTTPTLTLIPAAGQTGTATITVTVGDGVSSNSASFIFKVIPPGPRTVIFDNLSTIAITNNGPAGPYASEINVAGMPGAITQLMVTLHGMSHPWPGNVSMLLVGPDGTKSLIFSGVAWGSFPAAGMTFTLSDGAEFPLPSQSALLPGTYRTASYNSPRVPASGANFPTPAPAGPYTTSTLSAFTNSPIGTWRLYVYDPHGGEFPGEIAGGWSMAITTDAPDTAPTISNITNQSTTVNIPTAVIPLTINDAETAASNLVLSASSSDPALVPANNFVFGGSGTNRTLTVTPAQVGTATITVTVSDGILTASKLFNLTVNPAALTVTASPGQAKVFGAANPALTYTVSGLQAGDTQAGVFTGALGRVSGENVGGYAINQGTLSAGTHYTISFVPANFTITPKPITVSADPKSKVFGSVDPALTYVSSDPGAVISGSLSRAAGENVGSYAISGTLSAGANYTISFVPASFTITPKAITVSADARTKVFGALDPALTYVSSDLGAGFSGGLGRVSGENVGSYAINQGTLTVGANYTMSFVPASLAITPKGITVRANSGQTKVFGTLDPALTYVSSDPGAGFTGALGRAER